MSFNGRVSGTKVKRALGVQAALEWAFRIEQAQLELPLPPDVTDEGFGFGLGVAVRTTHGLSAVPGNPGEFSWNGAYGTQFFADPKEKLVVVVGTAAPGDLRKYYREQVQNLVYGAMTR